MKEPGAILLVACYELGHQPLAVAWPAAFLEREGYAPAVMDVAVEPFDGERGRRGPIRPVSGGRHFGLPPRRPRAPRAAAGHPAGAHSSLRAPACPHTRAPALRPPPVP